MLVQVDRREARPGSSGLIGESEPTLILPQGSRRLARQSDPLAETVLPTDGCGCLDSEHEPFQRVGRYLLIEPIGAGSQAVVWRALQFKPTVREVALKLVRLSRRVDRRHIARLKHEAQRGQRIVSPAILRTLDYGVADGFAYLAMPLVSGCSLRDLIAQRRRAPMVPPGPRHRLADAPWPDYWEAVLGGLARICRTVQDAHDAAVVHRDIKPGNLLVDWHDPKRIFLADFGMGRDLDIATLAQLGADGSGTPLYMAPEKLRGQATDERRCDIYALGVTLFETVTLERPYAIPAGLSGVLLMAYLLQQRPLRPRAVCRRVPEDLERIILHAMAEDPAQRHPTATAVALDIEQFLASGAHRRRTWGGSRRRAV